MNIPEKKNHLIVLYHNIFAIKNFFLLLLSITLFSCNSQKSSREFGKFPLAVPEQNSLMAKWEKKYVLDSKLIDDMETVQSDKGVVAVTITITGIATHEVEIKTFKAKANIDKKQIILSDNTTEKIQLELNVTDQNKPYVAVISVDKNPELRKEIIGSYVNASILANK